MIEFFAKESHFEDHLAPLKQKIDDLGFATRWVRRGETSSPEATFAVVASSGDHTRAVDSKKLIFFCEHGAGQTYSSRHSSYAGGLNRDNVCLFLSPGPHVSRLNKAYYPMIDCVDVGVPKLDYLHSTVSKVLPDPPVRPVVCFSFHWDCKVCPETRSGFEHFKSSILEVNQMEEFKVIGHSHPRARQAIKPFFEENGIEFLDDFADVLEQADIYACDNSSTIFEFASIGKPVVLLNPPQYRDSVNHGLRFWDFADIGPNANGPKTLISALYECAMDTRESRDYRLKRASQIYYKPDGNAAERAATAILTFVEEYDRVIEEGNMIKCIKTAQARLGLMDKGQTAIIFHRYAIINDTFGNIRRRVSFRESMSPARRIRDILKHCPKNFEAVMPEKIGTYEEKDDFSSNIPITAGFVAASKPFGEEELRIISGVRNGETKTNIVYKSKEFKVPAMQRAWSRLEEDGIIIPGESQYSWEVVKS